MTGHNIDQPAVLVVGVALVVVGIVLDVVQRRRDTVQRRHETTVAADEAARPVRVPGQELEVEFTAGPTGFGLLMHDDVLAQIVTTWQRELEGGVR